MAQLNNPWAHEQAGNPMRSFNGEFGGLLWPYETRERLAQMYAAGLTRDASQIPMLAQSVRETAAEAHFMVALHSLALIGGLEAVQVTAEALQNIAETEPMYDYARAVGARLLAQNTPQRLSLLASQRAAACLNSFLHALEYTDGPIFNAAVKEHIRATQFRFPPETGRDVYALRELADIIYCTQDLTLLQVARTCGIDFDLDIGAKFKMQLMPLTMQQRIDWIIEHLSNGPAYTGNDRFLVQIAADAGKMASRAAAAKLREMDQHREQYVHTFLDSQACPRRYFGGYYGLFGIIQAVGDSDLEPMIARTLSHPEPAIASQAQKIYKTVKAGIPVVCSPGY